MKTVVIEVEVKDDFKLGHCADCDFHRGNDQCKLKEVLSKGTCSLNCFCPLILKHG